MNRLQRKWHDIAYAALIGAVIACVAVALSPVYAQAAPAAALDAQALKKLGEANLASAQSGEFASAVGAIADASACEKVEASQRGMCVVMAKSFGMIAFVIGKQSETVTQVIEAAPAHTQAAPSEPPPRKEWWERAWDWASGATGKLFDVGLALGTQHFQNKLGIRQSDNATAQHVATVNGFVSLNQGTVAVAQTGFRTGARTARDAFRMGSQIATAPRPPTTQITVTGSGNNVGGGDVNTTTTTTTNTVSCPQNTQANGGNAAPGGPGGTATGANGGPSGNGAPPSTNPIANCTAGK